jgi:hypothetical protein
MVHQFESHFIVVIKQLNQLVIYDTDEESVVTIPYDLCALPDAISYVFTDEVGHSFFKYYRNT